MKRQLAAAVLVPLLLLPAPSLASPSPPVIINTESGESSARVEWQAAPGADAYNFYLQTADGRFSKINQKPVHDTFVRLTGLTNGQPYTFAVTTVDAGGNESPASLTQMLAPTGYGYTTLTIKGGTKAADYALFTIPYFTDAKSVQEIFRYLPPYDGKRWRIFSVEHGEYREFTAINGIEPGKAYWFIAADRTDLFLSGKTVYGAAPFHIRLVSGWNLIGSPFLYPVDWSAVLAHNSQIAPYLGSTIWNFSDGGYEKADILLPFHGYLVFNASDNDIDLAIPPTPARPKILEEQPPIAATRQVGDDGWLIKLSVSDGSYHDTDNYIGIVPDANVEQDSLNNAEPPAWPQHLSVYFVRGDATGIRRSSDIRRTASNGWVTIIRGGENRKVTLSWKTVAGNPKMILIDTAKNRQIDMNLNSSYVFSRTSTAARKFIIIGNGR